VGPHVIPLSSPAHSFLCGPHVVALYHILPTPSHAVVPILRPCLVPLWLRFRWPSHSLPCNRAYIKALCWCRSGSGSELWHRSQKSNTKHSHEEKHFQVSSRGARAILAVRTWSHILVLRSLSSICGAAYEKLCKMTYKTMLPDLIRGKYA